MKKRLYLVLALTCILFDLHAKEKSPSAQEKPLKIGYTRIDYILSFLPETKKVESECKSFEKQLKNQLEVKIGEYQQKVQAFQQGYETMTEAVRKQKQVEVQRLQSDLEQLQLESQEKLANKHNSLLNPIYEKIINTIKEVAKENAYTHIFNADIGGMPMLLYVEEEYNISELVLKKLGIDLANAKDKKK